jgi:hypothetical protein
MVSGLAFRNTELREVHVAQHSTIELELNLLKPTSRLLGELLLARGWFRGFFLTRRVQVTFSLPGDLLDSCYLLQLLLQTCPLLLDLSNFFFD